jgi:hypothetical protein
MGLGWMHKTKKKGNECKFQSKLMHERITSNLIHKTKSHLDFGRAHQILIPIRDFMINNGGCIKVAKNYRT